MTLLIYNGERLVGTVALAGGRATATGDARRLLGSTVLEPGTLRELGPADGRKWLEGLRALFRGQQWAEIRD